MATTTEDDFARTWKEATALDGVEQAAGEKPAELPTTTAMTPEELYATTWQNEQNGYYDTKPLQVSMPIPEEPAGTAAPVAEKPVGTEAEPEAEYEVRWTGGTEADDGQTVLIDPKTGQVVKSFAGKLFDDAALANNNRMAASKISEVTGWAAPAKPMPKPAPAPAPAQAPVAAAVGSASGSMGPASSVTDELIPKLPVTDELIPKQPVVDLGAGAIPMPKRPVADIGSAASQAAAAMPSMQSGFGWGRDIANGVAQRQSINKAAATDSYEQAWKDQA